MTTPLIIGDGLTRRHDSRAVVDAVTCRVDPGARVALIGPSGSGKSTLLALLAGLDRPTSGTVTWPGISDARAVATVFQGPSLVPELTVAENLALPLLLRDQVPDCDELRRSLDRVGLAGREGTRPDELSGGQAQRVVLARALVTRPQVVLADEPTGHLDRATATQVLDVLLATCEDLDAALVVASHDPQVAARLDKHWTMIDGRVTDPANREAA